MKASWSGPRRDTSLPSGSAGHPPPPASHPRKGAVRGQCGNGVIGEKVFHPAVAEDCGQDAAVQLRSAPCPCRGERRISSKASSVLELCFQEPEQHGGLEQYHWPEGRAPEVGPHLHRKAGNLP